MWEQHERSVCENDIRGSVTQHDFTNWSALTSRETKTFIEGTAESVYGGTMVPRYSLADRKWIVNGGWREANRKHFPVNCLLLCSHVNTHTLMRRLLQFSLVALCCSHTFMCSLCITMEMQTLFFLRHESLCFSMSTLQARCSLSHTQTGTPWCPKVTRVPTSVQKNGGRTQSADRKSSHGSRSRYL